MRTHFNNAFLEDSTETLRAIAHPIRIAMIDILFKKKEMNVTDIFEYLEIDQAVASHHLRILKNQNVVNVRRDGKNSFYSLTDEDFHTIITVLTTVKSK
ncbi:MAG: metalloregulator ArsR/SmtB family transcription factor [Saprospiraceae bacterium]|nr:metalloregulator ArsR/SmtB family transcription factor [Saprospiraceae bacterium]